MQYLTLDSASMKYRRSLFRLSNETHSMKEIRDLWLERDHTAIALYYLIMELAHKAHDGVSLSVVLPIKEVGIYSFLRSDRLQTSLEELSKKSQISLKEDKLNLELATPKYWLRKNSHKTLAPKLSKQSTKISKTLDKQITTVTLYYDLWKERYGSRAPLMPKHRAALKRVETEFGVTRAEELLRAYFQIPDPWVITKHHDAVTFENNLEKVSAFMESGTVQVAPKSLSNTLNNAQVLREFMQSNDEEVGF